MHWTERHCFKPISLITDPGKEKSFKVLQYAVVVYIDAPYLLPWRGTRQRRHVRRRVEELGGSRCSAWAALKTWGYCGHAAVMGELRRTRWEAEQLAKGETAGWRDSAWESA